MTSAAPRWSRIALSGFAAVLVPYYWMHGAWRNFLWLSDVSLFVSVLALWCESPLLNSMLAVGVLPFELYWNLTFFVRLTTGIRIGVIPDYMFNPAVPLVARAVSLFHVAMPVVWIRYLLLWGYDRRALLWQTLLFWAVVAATYSLTAPAENINWVFMPRGLGLRWLPEYVWLIAYVALVPLGIYWPLHRVYARSVPPAADRRR